MKVVDFYFDFISPFAYFAWLQLKELQKKVDFTLKLHPVVFGKLLDHWGQLGPAEIPMKRRVTFEFANRYASQRGLSMVGPKTHPFHPLLTLRCSLVQASGEKQMQVVDTLFEAIWCDGIDAASVEEVVSVLSESGVDGAELVKRTQEPIVKESLKTETMLAIEKGVFGVPTMLVDDEFFWGNDNVEFLALYLQGQDPLDKEQATRDKGRERAIDRKKLLEKK